MKEKKEELITNRKKVVRWKKAKAEQENQELIVLRSKPVQINQHTYTQTKLAQGEERIQFRRETKATTEKELKRIHDVV